MKSLQAGDQALASLTFTIIISHAIFLSGIKIKLLEIFCSKLNLLTCPWLSNDYHYQRQSHCNDVNHTVHGTPFDFTIIFGK